MYFHQQRCKTYKHDASLTKEQNAAEMILSHVPPTKVTVQIDFDTTQISRIPEDWPAIILNFMKEGHAEYVPLRPIYFTYEDRGQIVSFFIETFKRLCCFRISYINRTMGKIDAVLTDSAS